MGFWHCSTCGQQGRRISSDDDEDIVLAVELSKEDAETDFASRQRHIGYDRRSEMDVQRGDSVFINVAAFTASRFRNREAIPCEVLDVQPGRMLVRTQFPYRVFTIWVSEDWVEQAGRFSASW